MCAFWSTALGYELAPPPTGFETWDAYWKDVGVPEGELGGGPDRIRDPSGRGPNIWFQVVDEPKNGKNRLHLDLRASGGRSVPIQIRKQRVDAEAERLIRAGATKLWDWDEEGIDHYAIGMADPEGNEFDIN